MLPYFKVAPQEFGGTTTIIQLFRVTNTLLATNVLLVVITLPAPYTFDYEISLMMIAITGQGLQSSITLAPPMMIEFHFGSPHFIVTWASIL